MIIRKGGPCTCSPGRYIRFIIPPGVPDAEPVISCRDNEAGELTVKEHAIPAGAEIVMHCPEVRG